MFTVKSKDDNYLKTYNGQRRTYLIKKCNVLSILKGIVKPKKND